MQTSEARTFAQFGGLLLIVSLVLPYFAISFAGLGGQGFRLWTVDKGAFVLVAAYGLLALSQLSLSSRESMAVIYLICGGLFTAALVYKIWISPPGSAPIALPTLTGGSSGSATVNGKSINGASAKDLLSAMGIEMKASYGAFVAMLGSAFFTVGAFLEFRSAGDSASAPAAAPTIAQMQQQAAAQAPAPAHYQAPAAHVGAPDPFAKPAAPAAPAAPVVPPDPFARPAAAPVAAPPAPPAQQQAYRPPGPPAAPGA